MFVFVFVFVFSVFMTRFRSVLCTVVGLWCAGDVTCVELLRRSYLSHAIPLPGLELMDDRKKTSLTKRQIIEKYVSPHSNRQSRIFSSLHAVAISVTPRRYRLCVGQKYDWLNEVPYNGRYCLFR